MNEKNHLLKKSPRILRYSSLGLEMGIAVAIGYFIGHWLDGKLGTDPWLTLLFLLFGIAAGFRSVIKLTMEELRKEHKEDESPGE
jgi:ATP synthase protein I